MPDVLERLDSALSDRYAVEREIGRGGMATVFLAEDLKHGRKVAIKVLHPDLAATVGAERFLREIEIVAGLNHPHILALHDSGEADGLLYFVMPYVDGESLRDRLERERHLTVEAALEIAGQVARALEHAHSHGVIHRDIKPANIMLSDAGALVTDFGVARAIATVGETKLTQAGMTAGTPNYMSPEQASGEDIDARSDVYSLGCVLYEMLGGEPPLTGPTAQAILARRMTETPTPLPVLRDTVPAGVDVVVQRALARLPVDRYGSAAELAGGLEDAAEGRIEVPATRPPKRRLSRAVVAGLAGGLVLVLAWGAGVLFPPAAPEIDLRRVAVLPLENRTGDPELDYVGQEVAERIGDVIRREEAGDVVVMAELARASAGSEAPVADVAASAGAARIISGAFSHAGDSLQIRITVTDAVGGVELVTATAAGPGSLSEDVKRRTEDQIAVIFQMLRREKDPAAWVPLPSLESYRGTLEAISLFDEYRYGEAYATAVAAARLDTTYLLPKLYAYAAAGDSATADSVWHSLDPHRERLSEGWLRFYEHLEVYRGLGSRDDYAEDVYRAAGRQTELLKGHGTYTIYAIHCLNLNRPEEAVAVLEEAVRLARQDPTGFKWSDCESCVRAGMRESAYANHVLGEHDAEFEFVRALLDLEPENLLHRYLELLALVGVGRVEEVERGVEELASLARSGWLTPGRAMRRIGQSLRQHGQEASAARVLNRSMRWYEGLPDDEAQSLRTEHGYALYYAGRFGEARAMLEALETDMWENVEFVGTMGRIAARTGDEEGIARRVKILRTLDASTALYRGQPKRQLAQIQALRGNRERALTLLRQAVAEGAGRSVFVPPSMIAYDFAGMSDYDPYQEFMRPKG